MGQYGLIGTYKNSDKNGIFLFELGEDGQMEKKGLAADIRDAKYLAVCADCLVSTYSDEDKNSAYGGLVLYRLKKGLCTRAEQEGEDRESVILNETDRVKEGRSSACYVAFLGDYCVSANYHEGVVFFYKVQENRLKLVKRLDFGERAGAHQVMYSEGYFYVPCLLLNKLFVISPRLEVVAEIPFEEGAGPRHGCFSADGSTLWMVGELSNRLYKLRVGDNHTPEIVQSWLLSDYEGAHPAAIRLSKDGRYVYVSVREHNVIAVLDTTSEVEGIVQVRQTQGNHPRDMILSPDERFVLAANKTSGSVTCFVRDERLGLIGSECGGLAVTEAVAIVFLNL